MMAHCRACDVRWADDGPCWCCGVHVAGQPITFDPDPPDEDVDLYAAWGVWG